jgi:hypothetical protein
MWQGYYKQNPVTDLSKVEMCGQLLAEIAGWNPAGVVVVCGVSCRGISDMMTDDIKVNNGFKKKEKRNKRKREKLPPLACTSVFCECYFVR